MPLPIAATPKQADGDVRLARRVAMRRAYRSQPDDYLPVVSWLHE